MHTSIVMTVIGPDRPGLVDSLATLVAKHGGNWAESRMARLGGQFAGILRVVVPTAQAGALQAELPGLARDGLKIAAVADASPSVSPERSVVSLEILGHDRPGIVREIARSLAECGVNVEELQTEVRSAPMSGESMFFAHA